MNKRLKQLVIATAGLMLIESSPMWMVNDVYAAVEDSINMGEVKSEEVSEEKHIARINEGVAEALDYQALGLNDVSNDNINCINYFIHKAKVENSSALSKEQIDEVVKSALKTIAKARNDIYLGQATVEDYNNLQIEIVNITNLEDVNSILAGSKISTISKIRSEVQHILDTMKKINSGKAELEDYYSLNITIKKSEYLYIVNNSVKNKNLSLKKIQNVINETETNMKDILDRVYNGEASINDYTYFCSAAVNQSNLSDVNEYVKGQRYRSIKNLLSDIDEVVSILQRINNGTETVEDYYELSIDDVDESNVISIKKEIQSKKTEKGSDLTKSDIEGVVKEVMKITALIDKAGSGTATVEDYENAGAVNVNEGNLNDINNELAGTSFTNIKEVQDTINNVIKNLGVNLILEKITQGTAVLEDYESIKVSGVTEDNILFITYELKDKEYASVEDVQAVIDENSKLNEILVRINSGKASVSDYEFLDIAQVTEKNVTKVNELVKGKDYVQKEQLKEYIEANIDDINEEINLEDVLKRIQEGTANAEDYSSIKVSGVTENNVLFVNNELKGNEYTSSEEVQEAVDENAKLNDALEKVNTGRAEVSDYEFLEISEVTERNLSEVNKLVTGKGFVDKVELKDYIDNNISNVNERVAKENVLFKVQEGTAGIEDYEFINVSGVNLDNIVFVNDELKNTKYESSEEVQSAINKNSVLNDAIVRIKSGIGKLDDYNTIGIQGVTDINLEYVNLDVKGKTYSSLEELKSDLNNVIKVNNCYIKINNGEGTLEDYEYLKVEGVTKDNLEYVNGKVKGNVNIKEKNLQSVVTDAIKSQDSAVDKPSNKKDESSIVIVLRDFWGRVLKVIYKVIKYIFSIFRW